MGKVPGDQHVARFAAQTVAKPLGSIARLQIGHGGKLRQRVADAPEFLGRLASAQLAAVPDDCGPSPAGCRRSRRARRLGSANLRQRSASVDFRADRISVMDQEDFQV
jgi:hypothetical protein